VLACVALAVTATLLSSITALIWNLGISLLLLLSSGVPMRRFLAFAGMPVTFTLIMALPACLNLVTPGALLLRLCSLPAGPWGWWILPSELTITHQGVLVAVRFSLRVLAAIAATFVLVSTTRPDRLWFGLRGLGVPSVFVVLLSMMYRYLDLLARVGVEMHLARLSRTVGRLPPREDRSWFAASVTTLFRRTRSLAEQVHHAMWSRGYTGGVRLFHSSVWRLPDTLLVGGVATACLILTRLP
jgi:cobalt ECF transporter T component CbiQ